MKRQWQLKEPDSKTVKTVSESLPCDPITAVLLVNRGLQTPDAARRFIRASVQDLRPPFVIKDIPLAIDRLHRTLLKREKILIFGDYDVDGLTATVLLLDFLKKGGAEADFYIPHRIREGYGLQVRHIGEYAIPNRIDLIITVDCGSASHKAVEAAKKGGIDVIVTDHHKIAPPYPPALAIVNPNRPDCTAGFEALAGVGVVYNLLICLRKHLREKGFWEKGKEPLLNRFSDLVALGTVADMVPLQQENRIFVKMGLNAINNRPRTGIAALMQAGGIENGFIGAEDIAYKLAPRLNAAGRLGDARSAAQLLLTEDTSLASEISQTLNQMNAKRQEAEQELMDQINTYLGQNPALLKQSSLVFSHPDWHAGILGIVAARCVRQYFRPVVLIAVKEGLGKGSARSIPGLQLFEALSACSDLLQGFGGHAMAAGLQIEPEKIDPFQRKFEATVRQMTTSDDFIPRLDIDCELPFEKISTDLANEIESLAPFGTDNPEPLFMARNIEVVTSQIVGQRHRRLRLKQTAGPELAAIQFRIDPDAPAPSGFDRIAFRLRWNRWNGRQTIQLILVDTG